MKKILDWCKKNIKEGVDFTEVEKLVEGITANSLILNREDVQKLVDENKHVLSELDSRISKSVENALVKFKDEKLPVLVEEERKKIETEMHPEETNEQKLLKEMGKKIDSMEIEKKQEQLKTQLRIKAKELNFDPLKAEKYFVYAEDAEKVLAEDAEYLSTAIKEGIEKDIKKRYGTTPPPEIGDKIGDNVITRKEFNDMSAEDRLDFSKKGGKLVDAIN